MVLRLGHRPQRDKRVTTHVALVARAFGADGIILTTKDAGVERSVNKVTELWGGPFFIRSGEPWQVVREWKKNEGEVIHLTVYGVPVQDKINDIKKSRRNKLIVVGAGKVPREIFDLSDCNISVTQQPHSEVAALAIFLHMLFDGKELNKAFSNGRLKVVPQEKGKVIVRTG